MAETEAIEDVPVKNEEFEDITSPTMDEESQVEEAAKNGIEKNGVDHDGESDHDFNGEHTTKKFVPKKEVVEENGSNPSDLTEEVVSKKSPKTPKLVKPPTDPPSRSSQRERKKVARLSEIMDIDRANEEQKAANYFDGLLKEAREGPGFALGEIAFLKKEFDYSTATAFSDFVHIIVGRKINCTLNKRLLREFKGFNFDKESAEYSKRLKLLTSKSSSTLSSMLKMLDLFHSGTVKDMSERIMTFLAKPDPSTMKHKGEVVIKNKSSKSSSKKPSSKSGSKAQSDNGETSNVDLESDSSNSEMSDLEPVEEVKVTKKRPSKPSHKAQQPSPPAKKPRAEGQIPSDEELKEAIHNYLKDADMEKTSLKLVRTEMTGKFSDVDLSSKKDFMNNIVKSYIDSHIQL